MPKDSTQQIAEWMTTNFERAAQTGVYPVEIFGTMVCPACSCTNEVNARFCGHCGALIQEGQ